MRATLSPLTLGTSSWRSAIERGTGDPVPVLDCVLAGDYSDTISVIDTSNNYGDGLSEQLIGHAIRRAGGLPDSVLLATKLDRDPVTGDFGGDRMRRSLEESRHRLGIDRIPLLYLHDPESMTYEEAFSAGGAVEALVAMKAEGIAASIGISGGPALMLQRYLETGLFDAVITHNRYTLVDRSAEAMIAYASAKGIVVFNAAPYGSAPLAKWPQPTTHYAYRPAPAGLIAAIDSMGTACLDAGVPLAAAALQFSLRDPRVSSTVVGINSAVQLTRTLRLLEHEIPADLWARLDALAPPSSLWQDPPGPSQWHAFPQHLIESTAQ